MQRDDTHFFQVYDKAVSPSSDALFQTKGLKLLIAFSLWGNEPNTFKAQSKMRSWQRLSWLKCMYFVDNVVPGNKVSLRNLGAKVVEMDEIGDRHALFGGSLPRRVTMQSFRDTDSRMSFRGTRRPRMDEFG